MAYFSDDLRRICAALPASFKDSGDFKTFITRYADSDHAYFLSPITTAQCAELLGITAQALRNRRCRNDGPPGYIEPANGKGNGMYQNRLTIFRWINEQVEAA
ncbi:hypothetical protein C1J05_17880 [Sulfitobacter sp. JL08]|uniref:hypothetical protein n=1 Tax=Sulfitobacter sp. JL08 TaxID=2070369 RepID=UPI000E0BB1B0|nr:hypothetical protein [Sulfitobacter sp. JL08]AXI56117.1 hypothetical protein C1J05_17880 [Sulfitobacter sp. JL08]